MKATYQDTIQMDWLLLHAREVLAEAEEIAEGRKVRVVFYAEDMAPEAVVIPRRVAVYARRVMGIPAVVCEGPKLVFFTEGVAVRVLPTLEGYSALIRAIAAHNWAAIRRNERERAILKKRLAQSKTTLRNPNTGLSGGEGGQHA
jgi:hypothetical protein